MGDQVDSGAVSRRARFGHRRPFLRVPRFAAAALIAVLGVACVDATASGAFPARVARTFALSESGHLHLTSHHGFTLNEQGSASGTIAGTIYIHLNVVSTNRVTAEVSIYPNGGSITGNANASYRPSGGVATFTGTMSVARGSGHYAGASGSGLTFTGTVQRSNDAVTVHVSGRMST
jgi:hypothetical protein